MSLLIYAIFGSLGRFLQSKTYSSMLSNFALGSSGRLWLIAIFDIQAIFKWIWSREFGPCATVAGLTLHAFIVFVRPAEEADAFGRAIEFLPPLLLMISRVRRVRLTASCSVVDRLRGLYGHTPGRTSNSKI